MEFSNVSVCQCDIFLSLVAKLFLFDYSDHNCVFIDWVEHKMADSYKQNSSDSSLFWSWRKPDMRSVNLPDSSQSVELVERSFQRAVDAGGDDFEEIGNPVFTMHAGDDQKALDNNWNSKVSKEGSPNDVPALYWNELSPA